MCAGEMECGSRARTQAGTATEEAAWGLETRRKERGMEDEANGGVRYVLDLDTPNVGDGIRDDEGEGHPCGYTRVYTVKPKRYSE